MTADVVLQPFDVIRKLEVPVFLLDFDDLSPFLAEVAVRAAFFIGEELLLANGVMARVTFLVELTAVVQFLQHGLDDPFVARIGSGGPSVIADIELVPEGGEVGGDAIDKGLGAEACGVGAFLDFLAVLIDSSKEVDLATLQPLEASHDVGKHLFIGVPNVGRRVGVVDGCGDVERLHGGPVFRRKDGWMQGEAGQLEVNVI